MAFWQQLRTLWASLSTVKRYALVGMTLGVLIIVAAVALIGAQVNYVYLYTELEPRDAAAIVEKLGELQVPHEIEAGGTAVKVPRKRLHEVRLALAAEGLPSGGGVGNELFDTARLGATEFEQEVNLRRALEGELARTIATIDGVDSARVHLVLPKRRLFAGRTEGASASVLLHSRGGSRVGRREVNAIVHLVATAVPQLTHERVAVIGSDGATLHRPESEQESGVSDAQLDRQREAERELESRVRSLLERSTGPGAVEVRVHLDVDTSARERTEERFNPTNTAVRSEHKTEELTGVQEATVAGVPGAAANLPNVAPAVAPELAGGEGNLVRRSHTRNWEVDRVVEKTQLPPGQLERLSVAVLVDGKYELKEGQEVYTPRPQEELDQFRAVVATAVGFDEKRGDLIELRSLRFSRPPPPEPELPDPMRKVRQYAPYAAAAFGALVVLSALAIVLRRKRRLAQKFEKELQARAEHEEELRLAAAEARLLEEESQATTDELDPTRALHRRTEALEIATSDPATAAIVLRQWLHEGSEIKGANAGG